LRIDTNNYQVQAVVKDNPANSSFQFNLLMPVAAMMADPKQKKNDLEWGNYEYITFLKLKPGSKTTSVAAKLQSILHSNRKDDKSNAKYSLLKLKDMHFESDLMNSSMIHGNRTMVNVFIVLAGLLLITACINYVNLTTARASLRSKEVSVRKIVGAGRLHLFGQFMAESLLVSVISLVFSLLLVELAMPWFRTFTAKDFAEPVSSPVLWIIFGSTLLVSFLLNGLYPAFLLSSFQPLNVFRGKSMLNFKDIALRRTLVVAQFAISVVLIVGTLVIYRQLQYMGKIDPGYNRSQVFSFSFPWWKIPNLDYKKSEALISTVKQQLQEQSATSQVSMAAMGLVNFDSSSSGNFDWPGRPKDFEPAFAPLGVDVDFQKLMNLKIKEGRWFNNDPSDKRNVLLNETAVRLINLHGTVIGQRFIHHGDTGVIIGIVKDFHYKSLHDKIGPMIISEKGVSGFYIKTAPGNNAAAIAAAGKVWKQYFPDAPFTYEFLDETYNNLYLAEQQSSVLITVFAVIAIFISALGLLGLAAFAAEQKTKEIGIRKVLGASIQHIVRLLSTDFIKMVCIASVIAFPLAYLAMNKWLQGFAYRISLSWWIFGASAGIALLIALITVSFQSIKAAIANPVNSLRSE
jgi:putative ABC transport system permease protein